MILFNELPPCTSFKRKKQIIQWEHQFLYTDSMENPRERRCYKCGLVVPEEPLKLSHWELWRYNLEHLKMKRSFNPFRRTP